MVTMMVAGCYTELTGPFLDAGLNYNEIICIFICYFLCCSTYCSFEHQHKISGRLEFWKFEI